MDHRRDDNGWVTFFEHYWVFMMGLLAIVVGGLLDVLSRLAGIAWIWCYAVGLLVALAGVTLIFYAKLPLYRQGHFFTFGSSELPEDRRLYYKRGYRLVVLAALLLLVLLVTRTLQ